MRFRIPTVLALILTLAAACVPEEKPISNTLDNAAVEAQQRQYNASQPIPTFDWSLERDVVAQLYYARNEEVVTYSVWRSDTGIIEGDCPSIGYPIPYDTSFTNPWVATDIDSEGEEHTYQGGALVAISQPEPNGLFASQNSIATWVRCVTPDGKQAPIYVESKVTAYPFPVDVDYDRNRVTMGDASPSVTIQERRPAPAEVETPTDG